MGEQNQRVKTITYYLEASKGSKGDIVVYTVPAARRFRLQHIDVEFIKDSNYELRLLFKRGIEQIVPSSGYIAADHSVIRVESDEELPSGSSLILSYENTNTTDARKALIIVTGLLY